MNISKVLIATVLLLTSSFSLSQTVGTINWSASLEQVKNEEKNNLVEEKQHSLTFATRLFELDFHLEYVFDAQGKLNNVLYYRTLANDATNCADEYDAIKVKISDVHGIANTQESIYNEKAKNASEQLCSFAATGEYKLDTLWKGQTEDISLVLNTWKGTPYIGLSYTKTNP